MYIEHACQQTQQVWPVEYEDQLTLLTSLESAEQYTHEHGGTILDPMPVFSARTVWHCVTLRITDGEHGATYSAWSSASRRWSAFFVFRIVIFQTMCYSGHVHTKRIRPHNNKRRKHEHHPANRIRQRHHQHRRK